eukprot:1204147-Pleurochrysis_carterae.AAC.1
MVRGAFRARRPSSPPHQCAPDGCTTAKGGTPGDNSASQRPSHKLRAHCRYHTHTRWTLCV